MDTAMYNLYKSATVYFTDDSYYSSYPFPSEWIELFKSEKAKREIKGDGFSIGINIRYEPVISQKMITPQSISQFRATFAKSNMALTQKMTSPKVNAPYEEVKRRLTEGVNTVDYRKPPPLQLSDKAILFGAHTGYSKSVCDRAAGTDTLRATFNQIKQDLISELKTRVKQEGSYSAKYSSASHKRTVFKTNGAVARNCNEFEKN